MSQPKQSHLEHLLTTSHKAAMVAHLRSHPADFTEAIHLALADKQPYSWRAAWVLWGAMEKNDARLRRNVKKMIAILPERNDSQQRELLMILQRMEIKEAQVGPLFDVSAEIWKQTGKNPSLRYNAFKMMVAIAERHRELVNEIRTMAESLYTQTLSRSVRSSIVKMLNEFL